MDDDKTRPNINQLDWQLVWGNRRTQSSSFSQLFKLLMLIFHNFFSLFHLEYRKGKVLTSIGFSCLFHLKSLHKNSLRANFVSFKFYATVATFKSFSLLPLNISTHFALLSFLLLLNFQVPITLITFAINFQLVLQDNLKMNFYNFPWWFSSCFQGMKFALLYPSLNFHVVSKTLRWRKRLSFTIVEDRAKQKEIKSVIDLNLPRVSSGFQVKRRNFFDFCGSLSWKTLKDLVTILNKFTLSTLNNEVLSF